MTPVEVLRAAAARIREVAEKASPGPWAVGEFRTIDAPGQTCIIDVYDGYGTESDAKHVAMWDPTVALLVAEVFDQWARMGKLDPDLLHRVGGPETLSLARAILGSAS